MRKLANNALRIFMALVLGLIGLTGCTHTSDPENAAAPKASAGADPEVDWAAMKDFWDQSIVLPGIDTGPADSSKRMLFFFDPNCPGCARQWQVLKPYMKTRSLRVRSSFDAAALRGVAQLRILADPVRQEPQGQVLF